MAGEQGLFNLRSPDYKSREKKEKWQWKNLLKRWIKMVDNICRFFSLLLKSRDFSLNYSFIVSFQ